MEERKEGRKRVEESGWSILFLNIRFFIFTLSIIFYEDVYFKTNNNFLISFRKHLWILAKIVFENIFKWNIILTSLLLLLLPSSSKKISYFLTQFTQQFDSIHGKYNLNNGEGCLPLSEFKVKFSFHSTLFPKMEVDTTPQQLLIIGYLWIQGVTDWHEFNFPRNPVKRASGERDGEEEEEDGEGEPPLKTGTESIRQEFTTKPTKEKDEARQHLSIDFSNSFLFF